MNPLLSFRVAMLSAAFAGSVITSARAAEPEIFRLPWQSSGIHTNGIGYRPHPLSLEPTAPTSLKHAPAGLESPWYGIIQLGPPGAPREFLVIAEAPHGKVAKLYVDSNANGDLTDDPACNATHRSHTRPDGTERTDWQSSAEVMIPFGSSTQRGWLKFYGFQLRPATQDREAAAAITYYSDYGLVGEVKIEGQTIPAVLDDTGALGHFRLDANPRLNPILWLGVKNPASGRTGLTVPAQRPFEVNGKWWAITNLTPDGAFEIAAATKPVMTAPKPEVDWSPGQKATPFTAKLVDGRTVKFPGDYRGTVVLLDFWATWCGPCVAEIPNVVKNYETFHDQGFEVLGISLDKEAWEQQLTDFTQKKAMPWPQVYDGKFWQSEVARLYGVKAIPHMILVDGDTGLILANKTIRGEALAPAIEQALAGRKK